MQHLLGLPVLVLGLGASGLAMARWCARFGAQVRVWDSRVGDGEGAGPPQAAALAGSVPDAVLFGGALDPAVLNEVRLVLKSPGLAPHDGRIAPLLTQARAMGVLVQGELGLFMQALAELKAERGYAPKLIAITGTNGKTTTTAMTGLLVERAGKRVALAGNIGPTMLETLAGLLDLEAARPHPNPLPEGEGVSPTHAAWPEVWVLELSSFQLDGVSGFAPDAAAVLNLSDDHLDWHGSMAAYCAAKANIFGPVDGPTCLVVNRDDALVEAMVPAPAPAKARVAKPVARQVLRFGLDAPRRPGDYGLVTQNGMAWLVRALEADETVRRGRKGADDAEDIHLQHLMPADALRVRGRHNAANALAALALASAVGCVLAPMLHALRDYTGEPHRVQFITQVRGVDAFDDSKGTNVGATVAAIDGLGADRAPARLVLILGGDGKGQDFGPLRAPLERHARAVATLGRDAAAVEAVLHGLGVPVQRHASLEAATAWAFQQAQVGDAVLLSPACASLDMFRNYAHRAEVFVAAVERLASEQGEVAA
jgi:UDP-N-acetylmuramoylalanine--D-glutamate ligase